MNARKKLKVPAASAMPCKRTRSKNDDHKSKFVCILVAEESKRLRMERIAPKIHEDHIAGKGSNSLHHYYFGTHIYPYASSNEDTCSESSSGQRMGKT